MITGSWRGGVIGSLEIFIINFLGLRYIGHAIKNFPELDRLFAGIGIDVEAALLASKSLDSGKVNPPALSMSTFQLLYIRFQ